jgi:hypothetical protein
MRLPKLYYNPIVKQIDTIEYDRWKFKRASKQARHASQSPTIFKKYARVFETWVFYVVSTYVLYVEASVHRYERVMYTCRHMPHHNIVTRSATSFFMIGRDLRLHPLTKSFRRDSRAFLQRDLIWNSTEASTQPKVNHAQDLLELQGCSIERCPDPLLRCMPIRRVQLQGLSKGTLERAQENLQVSQRRRGGHASA